MFFNYTLVTDDVILIVLYYKGRILGKKLHIIHILLLLCQCIYCCEVIKWDFTGLYFL